MDVREYARAFDQVERDYEHAVAAFGVPFEASESCPRSRRAEVAAACSCHCENGEGSLWRGWISPACLACRKGSEQRHFLSTCAVRGIAISASIPTRTTTSIF